jgi:hypothetical protein
LNPGTPSLDAPGLKEVEAETHVVLQRFSEALMNGWAVVLATLLGPILAVQAQKAVERARERRSRKSWVFHQLMATRAARVSPEHVQALNMIDLAFYGQRVLGIHRRSKSEKAVLDAWREYHDHLSTKADDETLTIWNVKGDELFINVLFAMAEDVGYRFDRVQLKKGAYSPIAHGQLEEQQHALRKLAIDVLAGQSPLRMEVTSLPIHDDALKSQLALQGKLLSALDGSGELTVAVRDSRSQRNDSTVDQAKTVG